MLLISHLLNRILVVEFYKQNSGLFLFIFFVMFGMVEGSQLVYYHLSLMTGIIQSSAFLSMVLFLWLVYGLKSIQFVTSQLSKQQHSFLFTITSLPSSSQLVLFLIVHLLIHTPVLLYAVATAAVAFHLHNELIGSEIIAFNVFICAMLGVISVYKLNNPSPLTYFKLIAFPDFVKKSLVWFYGAFLLNELKVVVFVTKIFSYFAVYGFLQIRVDHYEKRIALMGLLVGVTAHALMVFETRKWEDNYLLFIKNLPYNVLKRYLTMAVVFALLLLPEFFLLISHHIHFLDSVAIMLFSISYLLLLFALVHHIKMDMDKYVQYLLMLFLVSFGLILFKLYLILLALYLFYSYRWYKKHFYTHESLRL